MHIQVFMIEKLECSPSVERKTHTLG